MTLARLRWWEIEEVLEVEHELFGDESWSAALFWSELAQRDSRWFVVDRDGPTGPVLAYAGLSVAPDESWVQTLGVAAVAQGRGKGRALLRAMLREAALRGSDRAMLEVRADNPVAMGLYLDHGFTQVAVRRGYYQPSGTDAVIMSLDDLTPWKGHHG